MRRRRRAGCFAALTALFLLALVAVGGLALWYRWALRPVGGDEKRVVRIVVPVGAPIRSVGADMERRGVIRSSLVFDWVARDRAFKPGIYDVSTSEAPREIVRRLVRGDIATIRVTFPEGFTVRQIAQRLAMHGVVPDEATFLTLVTTQGNTLLPGALSFAPPANLEGYLFPDTYRFPVGATDRQVAEQMLGEFDRLVARDRAAEIHASDRSLQDIVTIASLVEGEAETDADRPRIAGVICNRLARGMHLEIDATVQYAQGFHKSRLLYRDLTIDSPYNTYRVMGLPPGAICCPGMPSIEAALHPTPSDYLYYVAGPDGRSHIFARTQAEHDANVARMRRLRGGR
jgi:UPF0755 protein